MIFTKISDELLDILEPFSDWFFKQDLAEVQNSTETSSIDPIETSEEGDASIEEMQEEEIKSNEEDTNSEN